MSGSIDGVRRTQFEITEETVMAWAALSGDYNKIHVDPEFAAATRYGRRIAHGPILASCISEWVAAAAGKAWTCDSEISFRFRGPVYFPEIVDVTMRVSDVGGGLRHAEVECRSADGQVVMTAAARWSEAG